MANIKLDPNPNSFRIIINTRGRVGSQITLENLVPSIRKYVSLVCFPGERKEHEKVWGGKVREIIEHPDSFTHLGQADWSCTSVVAT